MISCSSHYTYVINQAAFTKTRHFANKLVNMALFGKKVILDRKNVSVNIKF